MNIKLLTYVLGKAGYKGSRVGIHKESPMRDAVDFILDYIQKNEPQLVVSNNEFSLSGNYSFDFNKFLVFNNQDLASEVHKIFLKDVTIQSFPDNPEYLSNLNEIDINECSVNDDFFSFIAKLKDVEKITFINNDSSIKLGDKKGFFKDHKNLKELYVDRTLVYGSRELRQHFKKILFKDVFEKSHAGKKTMKRIWSGVKKSFIKNNPKSFFSRVTNPFSHISLDELSLAKASFYWPQSERDLLVQIDMKFIMEYYGLESFSFTDYNNILLFKKE